MLDDNGGVIHNSGGKKVTRKFIVTTGGLFIEGESLAKKLKTLTNYFDSPQRRELLRKVQDHHSLYQGPPANPVCTRVKITSKMFQQLLFYYYGLKLFWDKIKSDLDEFDGPNTNHDDKMLSLFLTQY